MTTPTTTAQATVLTEEQLQHAIETVHDFGDNIMIDHYFGMIVAHIDTLTEQVRVLEGKMEQIAHVASYKHASDEHVNGTTAIEYRWVAENCAVIARSALAALEGEVGNDLPKPKH